MRRRDFLPALAASAALAQTPAPQMKKGRLKQCVTGGVFARGTSLEDGCKLAASLGIVRKPPTCRTPPPRRRSLPVTETRLRFGENIQRAMNADEIPSPTLQKPPADRWYQDYFGANYIAT